MTPFLSRVAGFYYGRLRDSIQRTCFVFPNRRSQVFFKHYLSILVQKDLDSGAYTRPVMLPRCMDLGELLSTLYGAVPSDRLELLLELYPCYRRHYPGAEELDDFVYWGSVLLDDFDEVDRSRADARSLFTNVSDYRDLQDGYEYMTDDQKEAIRAFVRNFRDGAGLLQGLGDDAPASLKKNFLRIWDILYPLYNDYRAELSRKGLCTPGMVERGAAEMLEGAADVARIVATCSRGALRDVDRFVFVGLGILDSCEKTVLRALRSAGLASFCWKKEGALMEKGAADPIKASVAEFPEEVGFASAAGPDPRPSRAPEVEVVSVPSAVGQAKQLPRILSSIDPDLHRLGRLPGDNVGNSVAIVLADEGLLLPVLNSLPPELGDVNITMGSPLRGSAVHALMTDLLQMQLRTRADKQGGLMFYYKFVRSVLASPIVRAACGEESLQNLIQKIRGDSKYYVPEADFAGDPVCGVLFKGVVSPDDMQRADPRSPRRLSAYLREVILCLAPRLRESDFGWELDYLMCYLRSINAVSRHDLALKPATFVRLLDQQLRTRTVPFQGEPLCGVQVMGTMEAVGLDFENLVILSCNEGTYPFRGVGASFIPGELRRAFGLSTFETQDSVQTYNFYAMISRARRVWMLYDSRTEGVQTGEESRFVKQLQYHYRIPLVRSVATGGVSRTQCEDLIPKPADIRERMTAMELSASVLKQYLVCPARFFYQFVEGMGEDEDLTESMDARSVGDVYHNLMQALYTGPEAMDPAQPMDRRSLADAISGGKVSPLEEVGLDYLESCLGREDWIRAKIRSLVCEELGVSEIQGRNLVLEDVIYAYVRRTLEIDIDHVKSYGAESMRIVGLEKKGACQIGDFKLKGYIDRLDQVEGGPVRIIDYKTGKVLDCDLDITDQNAEARLESLFCPPQEKNDKRPTVAFQLYMYALLLGYGSPGGSPPGDAVVGVYQLQKMFTAPPKDLVLSGEFLGGMRRRLEETLEEIADPQIPFKRTPDLASCSLCDFKDLCGR